MAGDIVRGLEGGKGLDWGLGKKAYLAELQAIICGAHDRRVVVFVGSLRIPKEVRVDHRIVLTVPKSRRAITFRRMLLRNLENIIRYRDRIAEIIRSTPVDGIAQKLYGLQINARLDYTFEMYSRWIDDTVADHEKRGYESMTGPFAFKFIRRLAREVSNS